MTESGLWKLNKPRWVRIVAGFLVIFAGKTLSLAADDWRQERADRKLEGVVPAELAADLESDIERLEAVRVRLREFDATGAWLSQQPVKGDVDAAAVIERFVGFFGYMTYQPVTAAYVMLKYGGKVSLIRNHDIRRQIVNYYEVGQAQKQANDNRVWGVYGDLRLVFHRHFAWELPETAESFWPSPAFGFLTSWEAFAADPATVSVLGRMASDAIHRGKGIEALQQENKVLRAALAAELEGHQQRGA